MASLQDLYSPAGPSQSFVQEGLNARGGQAAEDAGLQQTLLKRNYETRTLPDIVNRQAGKAAFFSGATGRHTDRAREDYVADAGESQRMLTRTFADLSRQRILASMGVAI